MSSRISSHTSRQTKRLSPRIRSGGSCVILLTHDNSDEPDSDHKDDEDASAEDADIVRGDVGLLDVRVKENEGQGLLKSKERLMTIMTIMVMMRA